MHFSNERIKLALTVYYNSYILAKYRGGGALTPLSKSE